MVLVGYEGHSTASAKAVKDVPENSELDYEVVHNFYLIARTMINFAETG